MAFDDLVSALDAQCLSTFGTGAVLHPQDGTADVPFTGITVAPALMEDYVPGSAQGVTMLRLFVRFAEMSKLPQKGDKVTVNSVGYDLFEVDVDREGGATLRLRRHA